VKRDTEKCTFFTKKKNRPCIIGVDIEEGKWGVLPMGPPVGGGFFMKFYPGKNALKITILNRVF